MDIKLVVLDMDGTVLDPDQRLTPRTIDVLRRVMDKGVTVAFGSGRCVAEIKDFIGPFPRMRYAITENGTTVADLWEDKILSVVPLGKEVADAVIDVARGRDMMLQIGVDGTYHVQKSYYDRMAEFGMGDYQELFKAAAAFEEDVIAFYDSNDKPVTKINFYFSSPEQRVEVVGILKERKLPVTFVSGLNQNLEMALNTVSKGVGLRSLCEILGISPEETMAIGDNANDVPMLAAAGYPVAMGNAVAEAKAVAKEIAPDNAHDGVACVLERIFLS